MSTLFLKFFIFLKSFLINPYVKGLKNIPYFSIIVATMRSKYIMTYIATANIIQKGAFFYV